MMIYTLHFVLPNRCGKGANRPKQTQIKPQLPRIVHVFQEQSCLRWQSQVGYILYILIIKARLR